MSWRRLSADGCDWEVRVIAEQAEHEAREPRGEDIVEFRPVGVIRPPRRTTAPAGAVDGMSEQQLLATYRRALPIGGDHYGRPGKHMPDVLP